MDLINKGVQLIRRSTLTKKLHQRTPSQESDKSQSICKTPSITSSITSDDGSCYSSNYNNVITPGRTSSSSLNIPTSITITESSRPQSPINDKGKFKLTVISFFRILNYIRIYTHFQ